MRTLLGWTAVLAATVGLAACGGSSGGSSSSGSPASAAQTDNGKPVTITFWSGYTSREKGVFDSVLKDFTKAHPNIKVKSVGGINDDKIVQAIRGGNGPDVALSFQTDYLGNYCGTGAWIDLEPYIDRDKVDLSQIPAPVRAFSEFNGKRCAMPALADVYGLYYNKKLFRQAGIASPPKTMSELTADAKKLTQRNPDGSLKVVGFNPTFGWYEMVHAHAAPSFGAKWTDAQGKSVLGTDPGWARMLRWQKQFVDYYGFDNLQRFKSRAGDEWAASNAFETGKVAMNIDGEYRTAFIAKEHPELDYGTAPMPVDDEHPELYGSGYVVGNTLGIPRTSKHQAQAWELIKYLSTDPAALTKLSNGLKNVPTTTKSLSDPALKANPQFKTFLKIFTNPNTSTTPITIIGAANQELFQTFLQKWQSGHVTNLEDGLKSVDKQIEAQMANATAGQAP
jgi:multiple sugar transport system substrate-binding protein